MAKKDKPKAGKGVPKARPQATPEGWPPLIGLTVDEAAAALRCDTKTVRTLIQEGSIHARMVGRGYRIDPEALRQWIASGQDGYKTSPGEAEINAEARAAAMADMADPETRDMILGGE